MSKRDADQHSARLNKNAALPVANGNRKPCTVPRTGGQSFLFANAAVKAAAEKGWLNYEDTFTEVLTETVDRVEEIVSLQTLVTHGISGTTVTEVGTRNQNEITTTQTETQSNQHFSQKHKNRVYAINYNVLSFKDGLSGLRF